MKQHLLKRVCLSLFITLNLLFAQGQQLQKEKLPAVHCYFDELMQDQIKKNPDLLHNYHEMCGKVPGNAPLREPISCLTDCMVPV